MEQNTPERSHIQLEMDQLLATRFGRSFLRRLLFDHTLVFSNAHTLDREATSYNLGRQAIGQLILAEVLDADPSALTSLLKTENSDEQV